MVSSKLLASSFCPSPLHLPFPSFAPGQSHPSTVSEVFFFFPFPQLPGNADSRDLGLRLYKCPVELQSSTLGLPTSASLLGSPPSTTSIMLRQALLLSTCFTLAMTYPAMLQGEWTSGIFWRRGLKSIHCVCECICVCVCDRDRGLVKHGGDGLLSSEALGNLSGLAKIKAMF